MQGVVFSEPSSCPARLSVSAARPVLILGMGVVAGNLLRLRKQTISFLDCSSEANSPCNSDHSRSRSGWLRLDQSDSQTLNTSETRTLRTVAGRSYHCTRHNQRRISGHPHPLPRSSPAHSSELQTHPVHLFLSEDPSVARFHVPYTALLQSSTREG